MDKAPHQTTDAVGEGEKSSKWVTGFSQTTQVSECHGGGGDEDDTHGPAGGMEDKVAEPRMADFTVQVSDWVTQKHAKHMSIRTQIPQNREGSVGWPSPFLPPP